MAVEFVSPSFVHDLTARVAEARVRALAGFERMPAPGSPEEPQHWEDVLAANAAQVLAVLPHTRLNPGLRIHYRFYGNEGGELRIRPFVARRDADVGTVKRVLDWHPPPDAQRLSGAPRSNRDADLLYRHFEITRTAQGVFEYWFALQEIWASTHWTHASVVASASDLGEFLSRPGWESERTVEHCSPAVVCRADGLANLAVLVYSRLRQEAITLERIEIGSNQSICYADSFLVAIGPKGYLV